MLIIECLINFVLLAACALLALWIVTLVMSFFIPGIPVLVPFPGQAPMPAGVSLVYLAVGLILFLNLILCVMSGGSHEMIPMLWTMR